jgi:hypothetical protein
LLRRFSLLGSPNTQTLDGYTMVYRDIPGGDELLSWFGDVPDFHDAEVISMTFNRRGPSELKIHGWIMRPSGMHGEIMADKHAIVTFRIEGIMDLQLDHFSSQNVIWGLTLKPAADRGRSNYFSFPEDGSDVDIELAGCFGVEGFIRAKNIAVSVSPGRPAEGE